MSFFSNVTPRPRAQPIAEVITREPTPVAPAPVAKEHIYSELIAQRPALLDEKLKLHERIIDEFNLVSLEKLPREDLVREVRAYLGEYVRTERLSLNQRELQAFAEEIVDEMTGFGPIEPLLKDPTVNDILINSAQECFMERFGKLEATSVHFNDEAHLMRIVQRIVAEVGRRVDESSRPSTLDCPTDRASMSRSDPSRSMARGLDPQVLEKALTLDGSPCRAQRAPTCDGRFAEGGRQRKNIIYHFGRHRQRQDHPAECHVQLRSSRGKNYHHRRRRRIAAAASARWADGDPAAERRRQRRDPPTRACEERPSDASRSHYHWRVPREEAFDMLQAMNTGHEGSMTTVHANSPRDAIKRLEQMVSMAGMSISPASVRSQIASAIRLLIQLQRLPDGQRRVISIGEITGMEGEVVQMHEIFRFVKERTDEQGNIYGTFRATGIWPTFLVDLKPMGLDLPQNHFDPNRAL